MGETTGKNTKAIFTLVKVTSFKKQYWRKEANKITKGYFKNLKKIIRG